MAQNAQSGTSRKTSVGHVFIEMQHGADHIDHANSVLKVIAGSEAFRKYNVLTDKAALNAAGDLRGMVLSSRWRTVFDVSSKVGSALGNILTIATLAENIYQARGRIDAIMHSKDPASVKGSKLSLEISSLCLRTAGSGVTGGAHMLARSVQGYLMMAGLVVGQQSVQGAIDAISAADVKFNADFDAITDPNNMYIYINAHLVAD